ncbi:MAG: hypothetical protein H7Z37_00710 [Pyrinomonadaceae bacterium]|nr:hypothetical protein [Pyrinomonadaceae bacterium]
MLAQNLPDDLTETARRIRAIFDERAEWLLVRQRNFPLQSSEIEVAEQNGKLVLSCLTEKGWQTWRVTNLNLSDEKIVFEVARKLNSNDAKLEFIPRITNEDLRDDVNKARLAKACELAETARKSLSTFAKTERVGLSPGNQRKIFGKIARILLTMPNGKTVAVCGAIVENVETSRFLASSLLWFDKLLEKRDIKEFWFVVDAKSVENLSRIHALLDLNLKSKIKIFVAEMQQRGEIPETVLTQIAALGFDDLWREKCKKVSRPKSIEAGFGAKNIVKFAPKAIDVVRSKYGETLRFHGLPFARIRNFLNQEKLWFGVDENRRQILDDSSFEEFEKLVEDLREHRRANVEDKRHLLYRSAAENWLESLLRRDVSRLDPNLILAPLHAQFRVSQKQGSLDLLALRTDGRLVVIELKVSADREHVFQAANYWRSIELQRRRGNLKGLFGDLKILDESPLVYLVAPLLSFHKDFDVLAKMITPEIEIWRFDLNEDWREGVKVARTQRVN